MGDTPSQEQSPSGAESEQVPDYDSMSEEEIEKEFEAHKGEIEDQLRSQMEGVEEEEPSARVVEPPPDEETPKEEATPEPDEAKVETPEETPEQAAVSEPPDDFDFDSNLATQERLLREKAEAATEHQRFLADRNAGELGILKERLAALERLRLQPGERPTEEYEPLAEPTQRPVQDPRVDNLQKEMDTYKLQEAQRAIQEVSSPILQDAKSFSDEIKESHGEEAAQSFEKLFKESMDAPIGEDAERALQGSDVKLARSTASSLVRSAIADAKINYLRQAAEQAKARRVSQVPETRRRKMEASDPASDSSTKEATKEKSLDDMTADEVDAILTREFGNKRGFR